MDSDQQQVYNKMQKAALLSLVLFGLGLAGLSYWMQPKSSFSPLQNSRVSELKKWPSELSVQPRSTGLTLMSFWASWCEPCLVEIPEMLEFAKAFPDMTVQFINTDTAGSIGLEKAKASDLIVETHQVLKSYDPDQIAKSKLALVGIPAHFLVGSDSTILWQANGQITWTQEKMINLFREIIKSEQQIAQEPIEN